MKAVILVGGKAERLRPLTLRRPKAMVPILSRAFLATQLDLLRAAGVTEVVLCLAQTPRRIEALFGAGGDYGMDIHYVVESKPRGTAGALRNIRRQLAETFLCMNGDVLTDVNIRALLAEHRRAGAVLTLAVKRVEDASGYGAVGTRAEPDGGGLRVERFREKEPGASDINVGIYAMEPEILDHVPDAPASSLEREVFPAVVKGDRPVAAYRHEGYFADIGTPDRYQRAHRDALEGRIRIPDVVSPNPGGMRIDPKAVIAPGARMVGPGFVGPGAQIREGARIGPYAVIGRQVLVEENAVVEDSILWFNVRVGEGARVVHSILGASTYVASHAHVEGAILGDKSTIASCSRVPRAGEP